MRLPENFGKEGLHGTGLVDCGRRDRRVARDDIGKIVDARTIAAKAYRTIQGNLIVGVGVVHVLGIIAALMQLIGPIQAAMIHLGPDILVFLNSVKLLRMRLRGPAEDGAAARP